jgi:hypothetical protein
LLERVALGLRGTKPISRDGRDADREKFITLINDLIIPTGVLGGARMSEATVLRTKILLSDGDDDLPIESALQRMIYMLPSNAARLGLLLDLTATGLGVKYDAAIRVQLGLLLNKLDTIRDLFPDYMKDKEKLEHMDGLRTRVGMSALPEELKDSFSKSLSRISKKPVKNPVKVPEPDLSEFKNQQKGGAMDSNTVLAKGEVLFTEGDAGSTAYFIIEGTVEIYRSPGGVKKTVSKLGKGEIIGEMSLIDNQPRMASARALNKVTLAAISQDDLHDRIGKLKNDDVMMHHIMRTLVRRMRGTARDGE